MAPKSVTPRKKLPMTGWYDPAILVQTAIRVAISTVFGQFADRREAMAAANAIEPQPFDKSFDYSADGGEIWLDFLADTGDGWNPTYAMARLLAADALTPSGSAKPLPRGRILVLGGDEVYPTASRREYDDRFLGPFEEAYHPQGGNPLWDKEKRPDLYAIPGNHDWYDGLNAFFGMFCRRRIKPGSGIGMDRPGRVIGGRQTHQTRSYFAIRLPGDWWLWGTDSQLEGYIDQPQIEYFQHVARYWMAPGSKLILCVGQPSWAAVDLKDPAPAFSNFSYLERLAGAAVDGDGKPLGHQLRLVLSGDSHHYSRYVEGNRHYVTCGGGGAFLHPTHQLEKNKSFDWDYPEPGVRYEPGRGPYGREFSLASTREGKEALYPGRGTSWRLTFWNFLFAAKNWTFPALLTIAYGLFNWLLDFNARVSGAGSLGEAIRGGGFWESVAAYWRLVLVSPAAIMLVLVAFGGYHYFADAPSALRRLLKGSLHAAAQAAAVTLTTCAVILALPPRWPPAPEIAVSALASAIVSATLFGAYLFYNLAFLKRHWNEGFSSFAHEGYKAMLRMSIASNGALHLYPIGLTKVPRDKGKVLRNPELRPHLIEDPVRVA